MDKKIGNINFKIVDSEWDVYFDMALKMLGEVMKNNAENKPTVMIVPVGPAEQYPIFARLVNQLGDLREMPEWCITVAIKKISGMQQIYKKDTTFVY